MTFMCFHQRENTVISEIFTNPLLANPGGSTANDYKLQSSSPAIGSGYVINGSDDVKNYIQNNEV